jgi:hypothetical protein
MKTKNSFCRWWCGRESLVFVPASRSAWGLPVWVPVVRRPLLARAVGALCSLVPVVAPFVVRALASVAASLVLSAFAFLVGLAYLVGQWFGLWW